MQWYPAGLRIAGKGAGYDAEAVDGEGALAQRMKVIMLLPGGTQGLLER